MTSQTISAHLLRALGVSLMSAAAFAGQSASARRPSAALRAHVQDERFQPVTSVRGLPLGVRDELQTLFGSATLDIAEPGAAFRMAGAGGEPTLPLRRLVAAWCSADHCLVYYERGGIAHTSQALLFHWTPTRTTVEAGGVAPALLRSVDDLRKVFLSGGLSPSKYW